MRVVIYPVRGYERCPVCEERFGMNLVCEKDSQEVRRVFLRVSFEGEGRHEIRSDLDGDPLSLDKAKRLKLRIEQDARLCATDTQARRMIIRKYVPRNRERMKFSNVRREYVEHLDRKGVARQYLACAKTAFRLHLSVFDDMDVADITPGIVEDWLYDTGLSNYQKHTLLGYLARTLKFAAVREYIQTVPALPSWGKRAKKRCGITTGQQDEIMAFIPEKHQPVFEFYRRMGWRPAEVRALRVKDIQGDTVYLNGSFDMETYKPYPKQRGKGGAAYPVERVADVIASALKGRVYGPDDFVFMYEHRGKWRYYTRRHMSKVYDQARQKAGYSSVTLYEFGRHAMSYQLFLAGASKEERAAILNNTSGTIQEHYTTVTREIRGKVFDLVERRLEQTGAGGVLRKK